jgi:hypothetical protein
MSDYLNGDTDMLATTQKIEFEAWYQDRKGNWWTFRADLKTVDEAAEAITEHEGRVRGGKLPYVADYAVVQRTITNSAEVIS